MSSEVLRELEFFEAAQQRAMAKAKLESEHKSQPKISLASDYQDSMAWLDEKHLIDEEDTQEAVAIKDSHDLASDSEDPLAWIDKNLLKEEDTQPYKTSSDSHK